MTRRYNILLTWDPSDRVWVSCVPSLDWISTFGETRKEAIERTREAVLGFIEAAAKEGLDIAPGDGEAELAAVEVSAP
ncbi:MAG: type II toxin-antitoxin system HicB family antitoxin [Dehalococcoidia bacterium]|nr:type II toxin-antitoxin system HicB family antitoxin [Dehalococcoidia bacterium]